jgi:hypothetical protein
MPNHSSKPKRPRDANQLARAIVDLATGQEPVGAAPDPASEPETPSESLRRAAAELGRRGGLKGGKRRAAVLTPEQRAEIAKKAAAARWGKIES